MKNLQPVSRLKKQSTWQLLALAIITLGVYFGHYVKQQTRVINSLGDEKNTLSEGFANVILIFSYVSLLATVPYLVLEENKDIALVSNTLDRVWSILLIVWGFMARNAINNVCGLTKADAEWFHGFWTFLFTPLYFNYKVNKICEQNNNQRQSECGGETQQPDPLDFKA